MIKTIKKIDVAPYSDKEPELRKLVFNKIRIVQDFEQKKVTIHFVENKVIEEDVENQIEVIDADGNPVLDENGNPTYETKISDKIERLRNMSKSVSFAIYNAIATQVKSQLPKDISETDEDKYIAEKGVIIYVVQEGLYRGLTFEDFEQ